MENVYHVSGSGYYINNNRNISSPKTETFSYYYCCAIVSKMEKGIFNTLIKATAAAYAQDVELPLAICRSTLIRH